jgi:prepilin-type N-terminal cleavage/methylation domain-containing protein
MKQGFTLLEMLVVIAVVGVVATLGVTTFLGFRQTTEIQQAQSQLAQDLERVRQLARRYSVTYRFETPSTTSYQAYALKADGTKDSTVPELALRVLPNSATFSYTPSANAKYTGPFGRVNTTTSALCYAVRIASSGKFAEITLLGVTGRVTPRPIRTTGSPCV